MLTQLLGQVFRPKVCVSLQHPQVFVARDACHLHDVEPTLEQPGGRLVAQVVEVEVLDACPPDGTAAPTYSRYAAILCFSICFLWRVSCRLHSP